MNDNNLDANKKIIRETFNDVREIKCITSQKDDILDEDIHLEGDLYITETGGFIYFKFQKSDFSEDDLVKYVELAEYLYEKNKKHVSIYIVCLDYVQVSVKECDILSEADFTIKLAKHGANPYKALDEIKLKLKHERYIDSGDIEILKRLPGICEPEERSYFLREYFRIISRI